MAHILIGVRIFANVESDALGKRTVLRDGNRSVDLLERPIAFSGGVKSNNHKARTGRQMGLRIDRLFCVVRDLADVFNIQHVYLPK